MSSNDTPQELMFKGRCLMGKHENKEAFSCFLEAARRRYIPALYYVACGLYPGCGEYSIEGAEKDSYQALALLHWAGRRKQFPGETPGRRPFLTMFIG